LRNYNNINGPGPRYARTELAILFALHISTTIFYYLNYSDGGTDGIKIVEFTFGFHPHHLHNVVYSLFSAILGSYELLILIYSLLGFVGILLINKSLERLCALASRNDTSYFRLVRIVVIFNPALHLWTSYITKESLLVFAAGLILYFSNKQKFITPSVLLYPIIFLLRPWYGFCVLLCSLQQPRFTFLLLSLAVGLVFALPSEFIFKSIDFNDQLSYEAFRSWLDQRYLETCALIYQSQRYPIECDATLISRIKTGLFLPVLSADFRVTDTLIMGARLLFLALAGRLIIALCIFFFHGVLYRPLATLRSFLFGLVVLFISLQFPISWLTMANFGLILRFEAILMPLLLYSALVWRNSVTVSRYRL